MRLTDILTESPFISAVQGKSFSTLLVQCITGSSRAISKYLSIPQDELQSRYYKSIKDAFKAQDQDILNDIRDVVHDLVNSGVMQDPNQSKSFKELFGYIDQAIRQKRDAE